MKCNKEITNEAGKHEVRTQGGIRGVYQQKSSFILVRGLGWIGRGVSVGPEVGAEKGTKGSVGGDIGVPAGALRDDRRREPLALGAPSLVLVLVPQPWEGPRSLRTIPSTTRNSRENLGEDGGGSATVGGQRTRATKTTE